MEFGVCEVLCWYVSHQFGYRHMGELDSSSGHFNLDLMVLNVNVLCSGVNQGASVIDLCLSSFKGIALMTRFLFGQFFLPICSVGSNISALEFPSLIKIMALLVVGLEGTQALRSVNKKRSHAVFFLARVGSIT